MVVAPNMGVLGDQVAAPELRLIKLHETSISFGELTCLLQPMLGVIGVAPEAEEAGTDLPDPMEAIWTPKKSVPAARSTFPSSTPGPSWPWAMSTPSWGWRSQWHRRRDQRRG